MFRNKNTIGADETGVGDYFTPLVAASVFISKENYSFFESLNLKDSKTLTNKKIQELATIIKANCIYNIESINQDQYNNLTALNWNANELKMILHVKNINKILQKDIKVDNIIIDQFSTNNKIKEYQEKIISKSKGEEYKKIDDDKLILETKAESKYIAVAAAAILARDHLLNLMKLQNQKYQLIFPLGAGSIVDEFGKKFCKTYGLTELKSVTKYNFKNTQKILADLKRG